jgi:hypothetical protein
MNKFFGSSLFSSFVAGLGGYILSHLSPHFVTSDLGTIVVAAGSAVLGVLTHHNNPQT